MCKNRAIVYIDGFNLYHGLINKGWRKYLWLDLVKFAKAILPTGLTLIHTKYFTSRVKAFKDDPQKPVRQSKYLDALSSLSYFDIYYGRYQVFQSHCRDCNNLVRCLKCGKDHVKPNEKKTDVNIATEMLVDAFEDKCDSIVLVSGDSDYDAPIKALKRLFPDKKVITAFPPKRKNPALINIVSNWFVIPEQACKESLFPDRVITSSGFEVKRPSDWK